jgi:hypothetical protein
LVLLIVLIVEPMGANDRSKRALLLDMRMPAFVGTTVVLTSI